MIQFKSFVRIFILLLKSSFPVMVVMFAIHLEKPLLLNDLFFMCLRSIGYAFIALCALFPIVFLFIRCIFFIKEKFERHERWIHIVLVLFFLVIIVINILPIVFWIRTLQDVFFLPMYLILSNMLLYYYCLHTYQEINEESQKLYVISAPFKNSTRYDYLKAKHWWVMLNSIRPMFYHLFSFTLFTDHLVVSSEYSGIVGYIFLKLKNSHVTFSYDIILAIMVSICMLYPCKLVCEYPEKKFSKICNIQQ